MKCLIKRAVIALGAASIAFLGCTRITNAKPELVRTVSVAGDNPFGGTPAVEIPSDARAMSAFLKAEVAMNEGDREEALKDYAESVQYDPANAALQGRAIADIAEEQGKAPADVILDLALAEDFKTEFRWRTESPDWRDAVRAAQLDTRMIIGTSDGGAHLGRW